MSFSVLCVVGMMLHMLNGISKCNRDLEYGNVVYVSCQIDDIFDTLKCRDVVQWFDFLPMTKDPGVQFHTRQKSDATIF